MSNKKFEFLNDIDKELRVLYPIGMSCGPKVKIELIMGFELFNTRPYHNHEDFSNGYRITDIKTGFTYEAEDLDDAVRGFSIKLKEKLK